MNPSQDTLRSPISDAEFQRMLEQTLVPTPNLTSLSNSFLEEFVNRFDNRIENPAESFHLNSMLTRSDGLRLLPPGQAAEVRSWYLEKCGRVATSDLDTDLGHNIVVPHDQLDRRLAMMLSVFGQDGPMRGALYSVDLMIVMDRKVYRQVAGSSGISLEAVLDDENWQMFTDATVDTAPADIDGAVATIVIVGVPWRNMLISGPRGYRRMLIDTGVLLSALGSMAQQVGLVANPVTDFVDVSVDRALANDGLDRSALLLMPLHEPAEPEGTEE